MNGYIDEAVDESPKDVTTPVVSPVAEHLFKTNNIGKRLREERAILFHGLVIKMIFIIKHVRLSIHPTIAFITTRVQDTYEDDWKNSDVFYSTYMATVKLHCT